MYRQYGRLVFVLGDSEYDGRYGFDDLMSQIRKGGSLAVISTEAEFCISRSPSFPFSSSASPLPSSFSLFFSLSLLLIQARSGNHNAAESSLYAPSQGHQEASLLHDPHLVRPNPAAALDSRAAHSAALAHGL